MYNIAICIPTYKRPVMLEKLVLSIIEGNYNDTFIKDINIIIVDNDRDKTSEQIVTELKNRFRESYKIEYYNYPEKGISNVRNELIRKAIVLKPDYLIFIDDDEYVTSEWLNELLKTIIENNADAVRGPVLPVVSEPTSKYISCWFIGESHPNNSKINSLYTGNLILNRLSLEKFNIWFDNRFNIIGSGDSYFGIQILKLGAKIYWASNAIVYETIPHSRANLKWLIKRRYRGASTFTYKLRLEAKYFRLFFKSLVSLGYIILGFSALIILLTPVKKRYWGILKLSEGIGGLAGFFNLLYKEYK